MTQHHSLPVTYRPKADAVFAGTCCQTIRKGDKYHVGDRLLLHEWEGLPYRSKWGRRMNAVVTEVMPIHVTSLRHWGSWTMDSLAADDGIDPPTGEALRDTLKRLNGKDWEGWYQIITWRPV